MMSMSPGMSEGPAAACFSQEDYYLRDTELGENSQWCEKGAETLGVSGEVGEEEFRALCQGKHPFKAVVRHIDAHYSHYRTPMGWKPVC